jgi:hypothetical protein
VHEIAPKTIVFHIFEKKGRQPGMTKGRKWEKHPSGFHKNNQDKPWGAVEQCCLYPSTLSFLLHSWNRNDKSDVCRRGRCPESFDPIALPVGHRKDGVMVEEWLFRDNAT